MCRLIGCDFNTNSKYNRSTPYIIYKKSFLIKKSQILEPKFSKNKKCKNQSKRSKQKGNSNRQSLHYQNKKKAHRSHKTN